MMEIPEDIPFDRLTEKQKYFLFREVAKSEHSTMALLGLIALLLLPLMLFLNEDGLIAFAGYSWFAAVLALLGHVQTESRQRRARRYRYWLSQFSLDMERMQTTETKDNDD